jgi:histidinol-phosphate aminotransferase
MTAFPKPRELYDGLRLHQNENTGGCSPRVLEAIGRLSAGQFAFYPPYAAAVDACARYLGVDTDRVALTNGLDEGILTLSVAYLRREAAREIPEAIIPEPAFEVYRVDTEVAAGRVVQVPPMADFTFPLDAVLQAITRATRVVFLTNPGNPTGVSMPMAAVRTIAERVPPEAIVFLDEAYAEFAGRTFIPELPSFPNVIVGRTFSKAYGLAGLRIGCLVGAPAALEPIRKAIPVYSVNIAAVVAVQAALQDKEYLQRYLREVRESKTLMYGACARLGLTCWESDANFVLVCAGNRLDELVSGAAKRGVYLYDRSSLPGCAGCVRIATGIVEHTRRCITVMEDVLSSR